MSPRGPVQCAARRTRVSAGGEGTRGRRAGGGAVAAAPRGRDVRRAVSGLLRARGRSRPAISASCSRLLWHGVVRRNAGGEVGARRCFAVRGWLALSLDAPRGACGWVGGSAVWLGGKGEPALRTVREPRAARAVRARSAARAVRGDAGEGGSARRARQRSRGGARASARALRGLRLKTEVREVSRQRPEGLGLFLS